MKEKDPDLEKMRALVRDEIITFSRQHVKLTPNDLAARIEEKGLQGLKGTRWWAVINIISEVKALIEEGKVAGEVERGNFFREDSIWFDTLANTRRYEEDTNEITKKTREAVENIKRAVLDIGTKFARLQVAEIAEISSVADDALIVATVKDMIAKRQVDAQYFASTKAVAFNQQANLASRDAFIAELEAEFASWKKKGQVGKTS